MDSMIVCPEPPAAEAGRDVFAQGGNAVDAAVAAAFVQAVTNPLLCGIGGTALLYYYDAAAGKGIVLDAEVTIGSRPVPANWQDEYVGRAEMVGRYILRSEANQLGHPSVMVPGFVRGCWVAWQRFGSERLSWAELLGPAIRLARDGFSVYPYIAHYWQEVADRPGYPGTLTKLRSTPDAARIYLKADGSVYETDDRLRQPELAQTLTRLAEAGGDDFYSGEIAREIAADFAAQGGFVTFEDLQSYAVHERQPLHGNYRGLEFTSTPVPSNGPSLIQMLQVLEHFDLRALGHNSVEYIDTFARIQRAVFADNVRLKCLDLDVAQPIQQQAISPDRAAYWAERVKRGERINLRNGSLGGGTTHLTCIDADRNVVSFTHSIGSIAGSGAVTPGLGFLYNNFLGHYNPLPDQPDSIVAGKRFGGGVPTIVHLDGSPYLAIGAPGGSRLITSTVQSLVNVLDHRMDMQTAVTVPRFHSEEMQLIFLEPAFPEKRADLLRARGNTVERSSYMSRVQAVRIDEQEGRLEAGADPRGGAAVGHYAPE